MPFDRCPWLVSDVELTELYGPFYQSSRAHFDEFVYSAQATQPIESDQLRVDRQQGLNARSPVTHFDEFIYSVQATQPNESDQLWLDRHQGLSARSLVAHFDEFVYSAQATQPRSQISSGWIATKASTPGAQ